MEVEVKGIKFSGTGKLKDYLQRLLKSYSPGQEHSESDLSFIIALMEQTEHGMKKIDSGILKIVVEKNPYDYNAFTIYRPDGSKDDFSYKKIIPSTPRKKHSNHENDVIKAFRDSVRPRDTASGNHAHHEGETFDEIYKAFLEQYNVNPEEIELIDPLHGIKEIKDPTLKQSFIEFHDERAVLIEMSAEDHMRTHYPNCRSKKEKELFDF